MPGCPIRKPADQVVCADPRGLSQLVASFFASGSLGIPRVPLFTFFRLLLLLPSSRLPPSCPCIAAWTDFLCPLFYILFFPHMSKNAIPSPPGKGHVENNGFEPFTPCAQGRRSSELSDVPFLMVDLELGGAS